MRGHPPLIAVVGPTAVGKTSAAIELAEAFDGEIISADSRLVYRGMDVGTAKPSRSQRRQVPHHLIDLLPPEETYSLAAYRHDALAAIDSVHERGRLPFLVGGTGQYVTAVLEGWVPPPQPDDLERRRQLEAYAQEHGPQALHDRLRAVDPARAAAIDPRNVRRVTRALEIYEQTGVPPSELRIKVPPPYDILRVGLSRPRDELYRRIDERLQAMLAADWLEEVRALLAAGVPPEAPAMSAIGYRQLVAHLQGDLSLEEAKEEIRSLSRQFVRRQANWFKPEDPEIRWFSVDETVVVRISEFLVQWLRDRDGLEGAQTEVGQPREERADGDRQAPGPGHLS